MDDYTKNILQELSASSEENPDYSDIELIQYINVDVLRLTRLFTGIFKNLYVLKFHFT